MKYKFIGPTLHTTRLTGKKVYKGYLFITTRYTVINKTEIEILLIG